MALQSLQHLKIPFQEIQSLTDNFDERNKIGEGGFGKVYKGEHSKHGTVAVKRLERGLQGNVEFCSEIIILSNYHHENIISLVGFCDDNREMIIVYEYAINNSLDKCLRKKSLSWMQRLKISVGVAQGLHYLHTCPEHQQRVIHCDIKSANILLNEKWEAKISDFGLSKLGPKNQEQTFVITAFAGTFGYCDPQYLETDLLRKESDVFSFGVVLLEVLCGSFKSKRKLVRLARDYFERQELYKLVDKTLFEQINGECFNTFAAITCECVSESHEKRPRMDSVVGELEKAFGFQERMEGPMSQHLQNTTFSSDYNSEIGELDGGAFLGAAVGELLKVVIDFASRTKNFNSILVDFQTTLTSLKSTFDDINRLDLPGKETDECDGILDEIEKVVRKCVDTNSSKKAEYANKLNGLVKFFQMNLQGQLSEGWKDLEPKMDRIDMPVKSGVLDSCCVPDLPRHVTVGLDEPVEVLKRMVLRDNASVPVVITAPPGSGKTTLATKFCHDKTIEDKFGKHIYFVTVSATPNVESIKELGKEIKRIEKSDILLVLDDVWHQGESIIKDFDFRIPGYKLLVTSRFQYSSFDDYRVYEMKMLSEEDAISLFRNVAFPDGNPNVPDDLVNKIVRGCKASPLALRLIGGSLYRKPELRWISTVKKWSEGESVIDFKNVRDIIKTSLDALDEDELFKVKECYLDLGSFPEDRRIPATALNDIWVEKYDHDEEGTYTLDCLYELSTRNLINFKLPSQDVHEIEGSSNDHYVGQHDLLRELAIRCSRKDPIEERTRLIVNVDKNKFPKWWGQQPKKHIKARLLSISTDEVFSSEWNDLHAPEVEVLILNSRTRNYTLPNFLERMDQLKVIIFTHYGGFSRAELNNTEVLSTLPNLTRIKFELVSNASFLTSISEMKNLRKLSFIWCEFGEAFDNCTTDIANIFPNLIEVEIDHSSDLKKLPMGLCNIVGLKRLSITYCQELVELPEGLGRLTNLEVLRLHSCTYLKELPDSVCELGNLKHLDITDCFAMDKLPAKMGKLCCLKFLYMSGCGGRWGLSELPPSVNDLPRLVKVICSEQTALVWRTFEGLTVVVPEEDTIGNLLRIMGNI